MAITGQWKARIASQSGALKQGTGWNPIHANPTNPGRQTAVTGSEPVAQRLTDSGDWDDNYPAPILEYSHDGEFPAEWSSWGMEDMGRPSTHGYPPYTENGDVIRAQDVGADATSSTRRPFKDWAAAGWWNKLTGLVQDSEVSDPSQYTVTTSMRQRDLSRTGSQSIGRADEHHAEIHSRIPGGKIKTLSGEPTRLSAMTPRTQDVVIRGWWARAAGTGNPHDMRVNATHNQFPVQRDPGSDPDQGYNVSGLYGYTDEDKVY